MEISWIGVGANLLIASAMNRFVNIDVPSSARQLTLLEGSMKANDDEGAIAEPMTFVPECKWYRKLPCSCDHVIFHRMDGSFIPGWERFWHLPSLQQSLNTQRHYRYVNAKAGLMPIGSLFWHATGLGSFKNSLDVSFFVMEIYAGHFKQSCSLAYECVLTEIFLVLLDWLLTLKQWLLNDVNNLNTSAYEPPTLNQKTLDLRKWADAPWEAFLVRPDWGETFLYVVDELKRTAQEAPAALSPSSKNESDSYDSTCASCCSVSGAQQVAGSAQQLVRGIASAAFDEGCQMHVVWRVVALWETLRQWIPPQIGSPWPNAQEGAWPLSDTISYRLCQQKIIHRRVGNVELHFLDADAVRVGTDVLVEFLWYVTSDDSCLMVGTNFHNNGSSYYSWAHMLPRAHLNHWHCAIKSASTDASEKNIRFQSEGAATVSFSGFLSITACRVPRHFADKILQEGSGWPQELEVSLSGREGERGGSTWVPEPLRICAVSRPVPQRFLSACTGTLHNADYIHDIMPHAVEDWINYHILIGVEHITVFDTDGSYAPYLAPFIERGLVSYRPRFPEGVSPKIGLVTAGVDLKDRRPVLFEPHALDVCLWSYRHSSDWVAVIHSFEEYIHSPNTVKNSGRFSLSKELAGWLKKDSRITLFEFFQEPMGGPPLFQSTYRSTISAWTRKRGLKLSSGLTEREFLDQTAAHYQPFAWIADPLNVVQTAVHYAKARAEGQAVVVLPPEELRVNHYLDLGSNTTRCQEELGSCGVDDQSILWAEEEMLAMRKS